MEVAMDRFIEENNAGLAAISTNCANYYEIDNNNSLKNELADFINLHPLSDFLCGEFSSVEKVNFVNGKTLYFVAPVRLLDCGNGGCTYYSLLKEQPGLVRHIRGFDGYSDTDSFWKDADGSVFGHLSFDPVKETVSVYHEVGNCGTTNTYKIEINSIPVLIDAYDSCSETVLFKL